MRIIKIGGKEIGVRATPLAQFYYRQEFNADLIGDMAKFTEGQKEGIDFARLDTIFILQLTWALAKANAGVGAQFPHFEAWLGELEEFDFSDMEMIKAILEEADTGFFRGRKNRGKQIPAKRKNK